MTGSEASEEVGGREIPPSDPSRSASVREYVRFPLRLVHGPGARAGLAEAVSALGCRRALFVTSPSTAALVRAELEPMLDGLAVGVWDGARQHVPAETVTELVNAIEESSADIVIAAGGGSAIDTAKSAAVLASGVPSLDECDLRSTPPSRAGVALAPAWFPVAALPTTLSGAELTAGFSLAIDARNRKVSHAHPAARPVLVVHDAELLLGTPASLLASSGMNALAHAIEHLTAPSCSPFCRAANLDGAGTLFRSLAQLAQAPHDLDALSGALLGSALGEVDYPNAPVGLAHALCHAVTGKTGIPHGLAYAVLLPRCMRFTAPAAPEAYSDLRRSLDTTGNPFQAIEALREALALPDRLRDVGVSQAALPEIAAATLLHYGASTNARPVRTVEQVLDLLEGAW